MTTNEHEVWQDDSVRNFVERLKCRARVLHYENGVKGGGMGGEGGGSRRIFYMPLFSTLAWYLNECCVDPFSYVISNLYF